jgi:hypothetical protein
MSKPRLGVSINFQDGPAFGNPFILNDILSPLDVGILADAPSDIVDISDMVYRCSTRRGRLRILSNFEVGTASVTLFDPQSLFNPQNTASPYYGKLVPLRKIQIWADIELAGTDYRFYIFSGYITSYDTGFFTGTTETATVTLQCADGFRLLNNVSTGVAPIPGCTYGQFSGTRVEEILDFAGFPGSMRQIELGDSLMQADPGGNRNVLQAIQTVEQSEFGAFYMSPVGGAKFLSRTTISELADVAARTYSDTGAVGTIAYSNIDFAYDDQLILNDVTVTRYNNGIPTPAVPQEVSDAPSILRYFTKSGQRADILVLTDTEANDQARTLIAARKNAELRIDSMTLNLSDPDNIIRNVAGLRADIYTLVNIEKSMPGGSSVIRELFIQGVQHDVTPSTWNVKLLTAEPIIQAFILDSENQGILGLTEPTPNNNALSY